MKRILATLVFLTYISSSFSQSIDFDTIDVLEIDNRPVFKELKGFMLYNSGNYYDRDELINGGLSYSSDFLVIDGMCLKNANNFPLLALDRMKNHLYNVPSKFGNSLTSFIEFRSKSAGKKSQIITDVSLPTIGLNSPIFGEGFFKSGMKDFDIEILATTPIGKSENAPSFMFAGKYTNSKNFHPSSRKYKFVDEDDYNSLIKNLLVERPGFGTSMSIESDDRYEIQEGNNPMNGGGKLYDGYAKLNIPLGEDIELTFGNYTSYFKNDYLLYNNLLANYNNNPEHIKTNINSYVKFAHELFNDENSNFKYELQVNHQLENYTIQHPEHKDNLFNYGYVGKFKINREENYEYTEGYNDYVYTDYYEDGYGNIYPIDSIYINNYYEYTGWRDNGVDFTPTDINPLLSAYTEQYYNLFGESPDMVNSLSTLQSNRALINGQNPGMSYGLWNSPGYNHNLYLKTNNSRCQILINGEYTFDKHTIEAGFEHNKYTYRYYQANPVNLWGMARQLANRHIVMLDVSNPIFSFEDINNDGIQDTVIRYETAYNQENQTYFDVNLRDALGLQKNGREYIDIDNYNPDFYSLDMFSPDELLNDGSSLVSYMGYDIYGEKQNTKDFEDFFTDEDGDIFTRPIDAFRPVYWAMYGDYTFNLNDFNLNIGVRAEKYNANQPVLKDPYLLYEAYTVEDLEDMSGSFSAPDGIGDDYIVYVNDFQNPSYITAYRDEHQWYDASGNKVEFEDLSNGTVRPFLTDPNDADAYPNEDVFEMYEPYFSVLPKLNLDYTKDFFHVFAGHQQSTQNPNDMWSFYSENNYNLINAFNPTNYYFVQQRATSKNIFPNSDLKPMRQKISYIGANFLIADPKYKQDLVLGIAARKNTLQNMIYTDLLNGAFPKAYYTYLNSDDHVDYFSVSPQIKYFYKSEPSVKIGFNFTKNLYEVSEENREKDFYLWNMSENVMNSDLSIDWSNENEYKVLRNISFKLFAHNRSGFEYQKREAYSITGYNISPLLDEFQRMKSFSTISMRLDKGFYAMNNKLFINAYMMVSNLLNRVNYFNVYPSTGEPDDDGFLKEDAAQIYVNGQVNPQVFKEQYKAKLENPYNFGLARQIKFGMQIVIN